MDYNDKYPDMSAMYAVQFEYENKLKDKIKELESKLERTRKALDVAVKRLGYIKNNYKSWTPDRDEQMIAQAANGLDEIKTALEQKDK